MTAIKAFMKQTGFTHAEREGAMFKMYAIQACEVCGDEMQAPNSLLVKTTERELIAAGAIIAKAPQEGGWSDTHGCSACGCCC